MRYFASAVNSHLSNDLIESSSLIESRVLASNPILEAFGNAKTTRNDNSSRFGKYVQIFFDDKDEIIGAAIKTYLLEKTRVIRQSAGERNYHIFYQLLEGCDENMKKSLNLSGSSWKDFEYLKAAGGSIDKVNDSNEFAETVKSLKIAGFSESVQLKIFKILSAILHLGNLKFEEIDDDSSAILSKDDSNLKVFAELLGAAEKTEELSKCFTRKILITKHESVEMKLTKKQAEAAKDAVAKFLYSKVFDFIVKKLNDLLAPKTENSSTKQKFIAVLDIYGFEKFDTNSFEQFCINYANEKLQHEFNQQVFKLEQELYEREKIAWSFINFSDNQPCIDLIEVRGGILDLLDEECRFPNGGDESFLDKIKAEIPKKGEMISKYLGNDPLELPGTFTIKHFAYNVAYSVTGFLEKNRDLIPVDIIELLNDEEIEMNCEDRKGTTGGAFRESLNDLMKIIQSTQVHYIRCIKPNNEKAAMTFESNFVMQQLQAGGIIETIKISAAGYPARWSFEEFYSRYSLLSCAAIDKKSSGENYRELATTLLESQDDLKEDEYQMGTSQIFLRAGILARLEKKRTTTLKNAASLIQSALRSIKIREDVVSQFEKIKSIQSAFRALKSREFYDQLQRTEAANLIIKAFKRVEALNSYKTQLNALRMIQIQMKSKFKTSVYAEELRHRMVLRIQNCYRGKRANLVSNLQSYSAKQLQNTFKRLKAKNQLKELRSEARSFEKLQETSFGLEKKVTELTAELENLKMNDEQNLKLKDQKIKELESEIEGYKTKLGETESKSKENIQQIVEDLKLAHKAELEKQKNSYENNLNSLSSDSGSWKEKCEKLQEEKTKLELRFAKVEQYVRALMTNHIKTHQVNTLNEQEQDDTVYDKMGSNSSLMNFINEVTDGEDSKLIKFTSSDQVLEELLRSDSILEELLELIRTTGIKDDSEGVEDQEILMRPARIIYSWLTLSLTVSQLNELTENRMNSVLECIRGTLSESTDDKKCSLWLTNLIHLYGMIHHFIQEKEDQLKVAHSKINLEATNSNISVVSGITTQISMSELPPAILLLIRAEVMRLIGDIYSAWLKELCRWFGRAGIAAILEHQALPNYKVRGVTDKKPEKFFESVLNSLRSSKDDDFDASKSQKSLSINGLLDAFDDLLEAFLLTTLDLEIIQSIVLVIFRHMSIICFNQFLLKRNFISWKRAIQIQFNLSRLEDWCRERMVRFGLEESCIDSFDKLLQAVKVIQLAKTRGVDSGILYQCAPDLSASQMRKLLTNYVPDDFEDGPVPVGLLRQFSLDNQANNSQNCTFLMEQLDLNRLTLPVGLKERSPPNSFGLTTELPLDMPPTLWKLFILYLK